jgi:hypothetical protein
MEYIVQINSIGTDTYTIVNTEGWTLPLDEHPSILEHPELFEITDNPIPTFYQTLNYVS